MSQMIWSKSISRIEDWDKVAQELQRFFTGKMIVLLEGDLGVGKTEFVKAYARSQGCQDVSSPSFAIHLQYVVRNGLVIDHLDLYRIDGEDDLESTGFWDLFSEPSGLIFIEWPNRLDQDLLPKDWDRLRLIILRGQNESERNVSLEKIEF